MEDIIRIEMGDERERPGTGGESHDHILSPEIFTNETLIGSLILNLGTL